MSDNLQNYNVIYDINVRANDGAKQITELASAMKTLITNSGQVESAIKNIGKIHESLNAIMGKTNKITRMSRGSFDASKGIASLDAVSQKMKRTADNYDKIMSKMSAGARNIASEHTKSINQASKILTVFNRTTRTAKKNLDELSSKEHTIKVNANKAIEDIRTLISLAQQYRDAMKYMSSVSPATSSRTKSSAVKSGIVTSQPSNAPPGSGFVSNRFQKLIPSLPFGVTGNRFLMHATLDTSQVTGRISQVSREIASRPIIIPIYPRMMGYGGASNDPKMIAGTSGWTMGTRRGSYRTFDTEDAQIIPNRGSGSGRPGSRGPSDVNRGVSAMYRLSGGISPFPSMRNMPFMYMLNGYMLYSIMTRQIQEAVQYANTMETAKSILKTHDPDLGTFEQRFTDLAQVVRNIGIKTKFTSYQVADATRYLSMAGLNVEQIKSAMPAVSNLALIGDNDLGTIADYVTNIITGYGIGNQYMSNTADVIAYTTASSNTNILEMAEAFKMAAGSMSLARIPFEEAAAAIGVLGNAGIKATMAGTSLRAIIVRIVKPTREAMKALNDLKVSFTKMEVGEDGVKRSRAKSLNEIFDDLSKARGGRGATLAQLQTIFGKIAGNAAMGLLSHRSELANLTAGNFSSSGTADKLALVKQNTVQGKWSQVTSAFTENFTKTFEKLNPQILEFLNHLVNKLSQPSVADGVLNLGQKLLWFANVVGKGIGWALENLNGLINTIIGFKIFKYTIGLAGWIGNLSMLFGLFRGGQVAIAATETAVGLTKMGGALRVLEAYKGGGWAASLTGLASSAGMIAAGVMLIVGALGALAYAAYQVHKRSSAIDEFQSKIEDLSSKTLSYPAIDGLTSSYAAAYEKSKSLLSNMNEIESKGTVEDLIPEKYKPKKSWLEKVFDWHPGVNSGSISYSQEAANRTYEGSLLQSSQLAIKSEVLRRVDDLYQKSMGALQENLKTMPFEEAKNAVLGTSLFNWASGKNTDFNQAFNGFLSENGVSDALPKTTHGGIGKPSVTTINRNAVEKLSQIPSVNISKSSHFNEFVAATVANKFKSMTGSNDFQHIYAPQWSTPSEVTQSASSLSITSNAGSVMNNAAWSKKIGSPPGMSDRVMNSIRGQYSSIFDNLLWNEKKQKYEFNYNKYPDQTERLAALSDTKRMVELLRENLINASDKIDKSLPNMSNFTASEFMKKLRLPSELFSSISSNPDSANSKIDADNGWGNNEGAAGDGLGKNNYSGSGKLSASAPRQVIVNIGNLMSIDTIKLLASEAGQSAEMQSLKAEMKTALLEILKDVSQDMYS